MKLTWKNILTAVVIWGMGHVVWSQVEVPFAPRLSSSYINIKGDYVFLSNSIINRVDGSNTANDPYNGNNNNNNFHRDYIDIDSDPTTFSSSSSSLNVPFCSRIYWAGLYWSGNYQQEVLNNSAIPSLPANDTNRYDVSQIKFQVPGGAYQDITADQVIYDNVSFKDSPYVCFKDVTADLQALADPNGDYYVANVRATRGRSVGGAGGWTLVVVYENPTLSGKFISVFDGYAGVSGSSTANMAISGFNSIPVGPVRARIGASAVEGDRGISGDQLRIETPSNPGFTALSDPMNPANNFFNSNITSDGADVTTRNIYATNTLGYDADVFEISNPLNSIIDNAETEATLQLYTQGDGYGAFLVTFGIEIIEPNIVLEKRVENLAGTDITGAGVHLGQSLDYVLSFQNTGNDDATNYTIRDILPVNVTLDEGNLVLPPGVTYTYDAVTREIVFAIPDNLVEVGDPASSIRIRAGVASNCYDFVNACDNQIQNLAYSTYQGVINDNQISDDPSVSDFDACGFTTPGATNFLLDDLSDCDYIRTVLLCGEDLVLDAGNDFDSYTWVLDSNGNNQIDPSDPMLNDGDPDGDPSTLIVDAPGTYIVNKTIPLPCINSEEIIIVELFGTTQANPITALIQDPGNTVDGEVLICPNDGEGLPQIFLCGLNDSELIQLNIPDADTIIWERLDEGSCTDAAVGCANRNNTCNWIEVEQGIDYLADTSGEYRVIINYQNGCFSRFYFNVFKNPLDPQYVSENVICASPGNITVTNMPLDYEYSLIDSDTGNTLVGYQSSPSFSIASAGVYRVDMRQQGVATGCVFSLDNIGILRQDMTLDVTVQDSDCNGLGSIAVSALGVAPSYEYFLLQGGTQIDNSGITADNNYTFPGLAPGTYEIRVETTDGCLESGTYTVVDRTDLAVSALTVKNIDCTDAEVELTPSGGQPVPGYTYAIWSFNGTPLYPTINDIPGGSFQSDALFTFDETQTGDYVFVVVDGNNCHAFSNPVTVSEVPDVTYTTSITNESCFGFSDGTYEISVIDSQGYSLSYTLTYPDNSTATNASGTFTGLPSGGYVLTVTQTMGGVSCDFIETFSIGGASAPLSAGIAITQELSCTQDAIIEATSVTGGTPPYEFSLDGVNFVSGFGSTVFGNLGAGTYQITVRDANMCTFTTGDVTIDPLTPPDDLSFSQTAMTCPSLTTDLTATVSQGVAPYSFELISPTAASPDHTTADSATYDGLAPGTYTVRVTDALGCVYEENYTVPDIPRVQADAMVESHISCVGDNDGSMRIDFSNFDSSYAYTVTGPSLNISQTGQTAASVTLNNLFAGSYTITVTDETTLCTDTDTASVLAPVFPLASTIDVAQPTCSVDGRIEMSGSGGWGSYSYELETPSGTVLTNPGGLFPGLTEIGDYQASVIDANGCRETATITLVVVTGPTLSLTPNTACLGPAGTFDLTASVTSGGVGPFEYRINGGAYQAADTFSGLSAGTYTVEVRDDNLCVDSVIFTMNPELSLSVSTGNLTACGGDATVSLSANGGDGSYVYALLTQGSTPNPGDFGASFTFSVSAAGNYTAWVRDLSGGTGYCETAADLVVGTDAPLNLSLSPSDVNCNGLNSGSIMASASGGTAPYEYRIGAGAFSSNPNFTGLGAGNYQITVRDANGCTAQQTAIVQENDELLASVSVTAIAACDPSDLAEVRVTNVLGGLAPFEYSFDGGLNYGSAAAAHLPPGSYQVRVRDANNCEYSDTVTVTASPADPVLTTAIDYECDGEGTVSVTGQDPSFDYVYSLNGVPNTPANDPVFVNVAPGNHQIEVEYQQNTPLPPSQLFSEDFGQGGNTPISEIDPVYCYEPQDGSASLCGFGTDTHIQDGEYSVTNLIVNPYGAWVSPNDHTGLPGGRFLAINVGGVAGVNGIMYRKEDVEVIPNEDIVISLWAFNLVRSTASNGDPSIVMELVDPSGTVIASTATGNVPKNTGPDDWHNYTVSLNPGANSTLDIVIRTTAAFTSGNDIAIDDLQAYQQPVICSETLTLPFTVDAGNALSGSVTASSQVSCFSGSDGSVTFEVRHFDPTDGFVYSVNGGAFSGVQTSSPITVGGLSAGNTTIVVRDALDASCEFTLNEVLTEPAALLAGASLFEAATCSNGGGSIEGSATGGTGPYEFQLEDGVGAVLRPYQSSALFSGLMPGDYIVRVSDANGCEDPIDTVLTMPPVESVTFTASPTVCYDGSNNAEIVVTVINGNGSYQFQLNGGNWVSPTPAGALSHTFSGLVPGTYSVNVRDGFGCIGTAVNTVINPQLTAVVTTDDISACADGNIDIAATGGDGSYVYAIVPQGAGPSASFGLASSLSIPSGSDGDYDIYVRDQNGAPGYCEYTRTVTVNPEIPLSIAAVPTDPQCYGSFGSLEVQLNSGRAPFTLELVDLNGGPYNYTVPNLFNNITFYNVLAGDYRVIVTDADGCSDTIDPVTITDPVELTATVTGMTPDCLSGGELHFSAYPTTIGTVEFSDDGGINWHPTDVLTGYIPGETVTPSIRTVDGGGNTLCQTDYPPMVIPYPLDDLNLDASVINVTCFGMDVIVEGSNGSLPYEYTYTDDPANFDPVTPANPWITPTPGPDHTFLGLIPGRTYTFYVRDASGCVRQNIIDINTLYTPPLEVEGTGTPTCDGLSTGTIEFTVTDNLAPAGSEISWRLYDISSGSPIEIVLPNSGLQLPFSSPQTLTFTGLPAGNYYLDVQEFDGGPPICSSASENIQLIELNPLNGTLNAIDPIRCNAPGRILVENISGGGGTYSFIVTDPLGGSFTTSGNPIEIPPGSPAGMYSVDIQDQYGCAVPLGNVTVDLTPDPTIDSIDIAQCSIPGSIQINASSTIGASLRYSIDGGANYADNGGSFTGLAPGTYNLSVIDENGCTDVATATIYEPANLALNLTKNLDCTASPEALFDISVIDGSGSYDYQVEDGSGIVQARTPMGGSVVSFTAATADTYTVTIWDTGTSPNCTRVLSIVVPPAVQPVFSASAEDPSCQGAHDGSIRLLSTDNGILPLNYTITPAAGIFNPLTQSYEDLPAGTYTIEAEGSNLCTTALAPITLTDPAALSIAPATVTPFACSSGNSPIPARIELAGPISGGSGSYVRYVFEDPSMTVIQDGAASTYTVTDPAGGLYTISVYDSNGCVGTITATVPAYDELISITPVITQPSCSPGLDGEISLNVTTTASNPALLEYSMNNGVSYQASPTFTGLDEGTYNLWVRHTITGCVITTTANLTTPRPDGIDLVITQPVLCFGDSSAAIAFELLDSTGYAAGVDYWVYNTEGTPGNTADDTLVDSGTDPGLGPIATTGLPAGTYRVVISQAGYPECSITQAIGIAGPPSALDADLETWPITCAGNDGQIRIINPSGGWGNYGFYLGTVAPSVPADYTAQTDYSGLAPGTYEAWMRDDLGCEHPIGSVVLTDPAPISVSLTLDADACTPNSGQITAAASGGEGANYSYQLLRNGVPQGPAQPSPVFSGLSGGDFEVVVTDTWNCSGTSTVQTLYEPLTAVHAITKPIDCQVPSGANVTVSVSGGSGSFLYEVTYPDGTTLQSNNTGLFTNLDQAGTYNFNVTDLLSLVSGCAISDTFSLDAPSTVVLDMPVLTDPLCTGGATGSIRAVLSPASPGVNQDPTYQYALYDALGALIAGPQNDPVFTNLTAGTYEVEAISGRSCTVRETYVLNDPAPLTATAAGTDFNCTQAGSEVVITAMGGTAPYLYSLDNINYFASNTFQVSDTGSVQNLTLYVTDSNGCQTTAPLTLEPRNVFTVNASQLQAISCSQPERVEISVSDDGDPSNTYVFEWLTPTGPVAPVSQPDTRTAVFELNSVGDYTFRVRDTATLCEEDSPAYTVSPYDTMQLSLTETQPVDCFGNGNGTLELSLQNYSAAFDYELMFQDGSSTGISGSSSGSSLSISGINGGSYYVRIVQTDAPYCTGDSNTVRVYSPDRPVSAAITQIQSVSCTNDRGELFVEPDGGTPLYDISLIGTSTGYSLTVNATVNHVFQGLSADTYTATITDTLGCTYQETIVLNTPPPINASLLPASTMLACYGDTSGVLEIDTVSGGEGVYQFQLLEYDPTGTTVAFQSGFQSNGRFPGLGAGIYAIRVSDGLGCDFTTSQVTFTEPLEVLASIIQAQAPTCTTDAEIQLTATGGTGPYQYSVDGLNYTPLPPSNQLTISAPPGDYQFFVRDVFNCGTQASNIIRVDPVPDLGLLVDDSAAVVNCSGESSASLRAEATGGLGNYSYRLYGDSGLSNLIDGPNTNGVFTGLSVGTYYIEVESGDCRYVSPAYTVTDNPPLVADVAQVNNISCFGMEDGSINISVSGGYGQIYYAISPNLDRFDTENTFTDLAAGTYQLIAQDELGCFITFDFEILEPAQLGVQLGSVTPETCVSAMDGSVELLVSGGTPPYRSAINSVNEADFVDDRLVFDGLESGLHVFVVRDSQGCERTITADIVPGVNLNASVAPIYSCPSSLLRNELDIIMDDPSVLSDVLFGIDVTDPARMQLGTGFTNLSPGLHFLSIAHSNGCLMQIPFQIEGYDELTVNIDTSRLNRLMATVEGGLPPYQLYLNDQPVDDIGEYEILETGTYTVRVIDRNGCEAMASAFLEFYDLEIPDYFTPDGDVDSETWAPGNREAFPDIRVTIYDRYGRKVYIVLSDNEAWDGTYDNIPLPTGDYWYTIKINGTRDDREFIGHFTLYR